MQIWVLQSEKYLYNLCFLIYPGYFSRPNRSICSDHAKFLFFFLRGGGGREQTRYILGNRKSASGELLNEIAVTEGNLGTSC